MELRRTGGGGAVGGGAVRSLGRLQRAVQQRGVTETLGLVVQRGRQRLVLREEHVWYEMPLQAERPRRSLPPGLHLMPGQERERELATQMPGGPTREEIDEFHAVGGELWVVLDEGRPAFTCWIFPRVTPAIAARGGWLELPPDTVCLENSATSPQYRGRGVAPGAWAGIADALADRGVASMITKVTVDNVPSRKAVTKAGFDEIALMRLVRVGGRTRVTMKPLGSGMSSLLAERLDR